MKIYKEFGRNPYIDWMTILITSVIVLVGLLYVGYSLYNAVINGTIKGTETKKTTSLPKLNEKTISSVLERYNEREKVSEQARKGYTGLGDPSI
jgi:hypothetical protein